MRTAAVYRSLDVEDMRRSATIDEYFPNRTNGVKWSDFCVVLVEELKGVDVVVFVSLCSLRFNNFFSQHAHEAVLTCIRK